jgi:hypothetical protein
VKGGKKLEDFAIRGAAEGSGAKGPKEALILNPPHLQCVGKKLTGERSSSAERRQDHR